MPVVELKKIFSALDTNGDGVISADEIRKGLAENEESDQDTISTLHLFTGGATSAVGIFKLLSAEGWVFNPAGCFA